jgi:predicted N-acetyltransferase YhbS
VTVIEITRAAPEDTDTVAELIGDAFHSLAANAWLISDPDQRARVLPQIFRIYVEHALSHGVIDLNVEHTAVAVWLRQEGYPVPPPADYDSRLAAICGQLTARFQALDAAFDAHHPDDAHHHHLAFLAVRPDRQNRGLGSALLRHHHQQLDGTGLGAYLEASCLQCRALYLRHGYRDLGEPFTLPESGPPFWPMWRDPHARLSGPEHIRRDL